MPRVVGTGRSANLPRVPSAPVTRSIMIRGAPPAAAAGLPTQTLPQTPVVISLATPPPSPQLPEGRPTPAGPPTPAPSSHAKDPLAPRLPGVARVPDSFRIGYAEYLRSATTTDLFVAALPGIAGIAVFAIVGAYAGYRQARAVQAALLAPAPTRILL